MVKIYCIEDINDLKYIGQTKRELSQRLNEHKYNKINGRKSSCNKLNLYNCIIYLIEECNEEESKSKEYHYINKIECVNRQNGLYNAKEYMAEKYKKDKTYWQEYYIMKNQY